MRNWASCLIAISAGVALAQGSGAAQAPSQPLRPIGVVTQLQPGKLTLHTDAGPDLLVLLPDGVSVLRVPPGAKDLNAASKIGIADVSSGDRVLIRGRVSDDQKSMLATSVIVMTKTDLASARETERLDWQRRGIEGTVTAVNAEKKEITITVPTTPPTSGNLTHPATIQLAANAALLRYSPDSVRFSDAKPSGFGEIKVGDQMRALTTKTEDSGRVIAEKLVFGTFRNLGATVVSVDAQNGAVTVKDLASGKPVLVRTNADCKLRRLPPSVAQMVATFNSSGSRGGAPAGSSAGAPENGPRDFQQMLESTPPLTLSELKPNDALIVLSTEGVNPSEVMAIIVLAGVEPILAAQPKGSDQMVLGPWRMGMGGGGDSGP